VSLLHAHLVFATKYRRPAFTDAMRTYSERITGGVVPSSMSSRSSSTAKPTTYTC
jgi:hypothetical protein